MTGFHCQRCRAAVVDGRCTGCGAIYVTACPECGNTLVFEQYVAGGATMLRCSRCTNEADFRIVALAEPL